MGKKVSKAWKSYTPAGLAVGAFQDIGKGQERSARRRANQIRDYARQLQQDTQFQPLGLTTSYGGFNYDPETGYSATMSPEQMEMQQSLLSGASGLFSQASVDPSQRAADITQQQMALIQPALQQQQASLGQSLFGSGRLGLQMAGSAVGAGSGMVNPDMFGFNQALGQTLAGITAGAREQALGEQAQLARIGEGLFGAGQSIQDRELALLELGINAEGTRQAGNIASGQLGLGGFQNAAEMRNAAAQARQNAKMGVFSGLLSGAAKVASGGM